MCKIYLSLIYIETKEMRAYNAQGSTYSIVINAEKKICHETYKGKRCIGENFNYNISSASYG